VAAKVWKTFSFRAQQAIVGYPHDRRRRIGELPSITVVTPVFNSAAYIREAIESVLGQGYSRLQYIIVDGGSTDGTMEIVNEYRDRVSLIISEADGGMYDAVAKGFEHATGDILCYINADDLFGSGGLKRVGEYFCDHPDTKVVYHEDTVLMTAGFSPTPPSRRRWIVCSSSAGISSSGWRLFPAQRLHARRRRESDHAPRRRLGSVGSVEQRREVRAQQCAPEHLPHRAGATERGYGRLQRRGALPARRMAPAHRAEGAIPRAHRASQRPVLQLRLEAPESPAALLPADPQRLRWRVPPDAGRSA